MGIKLLRTVAERLGCYNAGGLSSIHLTFYPLPSYFCPCLLMVYDTIINYILGINQGYIVLVAGGPLHFF